MSDPLPTNLLLIDIETSGTNPVLHVPLAVGLLPLKGDVDPTVIYIRPPEIVWTDFAQENFSRYAAAWQRFSVTPNVASEALEAYLAEAFRGEEATAVGHNVGFDLAFLMKLAVLGGRSRFDALAHRALDTHTMLFLLHAQGKIPASALSSDGAFHYFGIDVPVASRHTAGGDVIATRALLTHTLRMFLPEGTSRELTESIWQNSQGDVPNSAR